MLNYIWLSMLVVAVVVAGFTGKLPDLTNGAVEGAEKAVMKVALPLLGVWAIWLGIMRLAERSGLVQALASALRPVMRRLFPEVPAEHPAIGAMVMNMAANMLGLGNAATPLGLRAMRLLESLNPRPGTATNAMVTFLALNTASIQILPLMAITILATAGAKGPTAIVVTAFLSSVCAASAGVFVSKWLQNWRAFRLEPLPPPVTAVSSAPTEEAGTPLEIERLEVLPLTPAKRAALWAFFALFVGLFFLLLFPENVERMLQALNDRWHAPVPPADFAGKPLWMRGLMAASLLAVPFLLSFFPLYAALRGVRVYEQFVEGAYESWETAKRTVPYLVAMLVAIGMLQSAGVINLLTTSLARPLHAIGFPSELAPLVLIRPLSGSAAKSVFIELVQRLGEPDGFVSRLAGTIYGSTETTFYVLAVYFGSVSIRRTRHAVASGLIADTVAVIAAVVLCHLMFGGDVPAAK
jgi:spore maturation protein SpmA